MRRLVDNTGGEEGFTDYVNDSMDPGNSIFIATVIFSCLLIALLPCIVAVGQRFVKHEDFPGETESAREQRPKDSASDLRERKDESSDDESISDRGANGGEDDGDSSTSSRGGAESVASALINVLLATSPHGGPIKRRNQMHILHREMEIEHEEDEDKQSVASHSVLGPLSHDEVSIRDAVDARHAVHQDAIDLMIGDAQEGSWIDRLMVIAEWDYETRRILKLGLPFVMQALLIGTMETVRVALIGKLISTKALSAYVIVNMLVGMSNAFLKGFQDACTTLCSQAVGVGNKTLAGQYIQIATLLYIFCYIPIFLLWTFTTGSIFAWLGFDAETTKIGEEFTLLYMFSSFLRGMSYSMHSLLDVIDREHYSTAFTSGQEIVATLGVLAVAMQPGVTNLQLVGLVLIVEEALALIINSAVIVWKGWFDKYLDGLVGSLALLVRFGRLYDAIRSATACCSSTTRRLAERQSNQSAFRYIHGSIVRAACGIWRMGASYGVCKVRSVVQRGLACRDGLYSHRTCAYSVLGPAEVATWGLLGTLWDVLELVTEAVADAGAVRTAFLLGAGRPAQAKLSSFKSMYLGVAISVFLTSCMFIAGEDIPTWLTNDPTLQRMTAELIPLFGIGNIALSIGNMAWTLVGAQGRYRLSTSVGLSGAWLVTIPLAAVLTIVYNMNLQGQTAAIVIGYMASGTVNTYILIQSDWPKLSRRVVAQAGGMIDDKDDSSSSSSSDSDDSSSDDSEDKVVGAGLEARNETRGRGEPPVADLRKRNDI
jgi:Na+-driven multidrug efflux pump